MTEGSPAKHLTLFALPLMAGELFQLSYNFADALIVGRILGLEALAAIGCTLSLVHFVFGFIIGLTSGFSIFISQRFGAGDEEGVRRSFAAGIVLSLAFAAGLTLVSLPLCAPVLRLMNTPREILADAVLYLSIIFCSISLMAAYNIQAGILHALGDSRSPLFFLVLCSALNIILDLLFILGFGWGIGGAAGATLLAQFVSALLCAFYIKIHFTRFLPARKHWLLKGGDIRSRLSLGVSMGLQRCIVEAGNILVQTAMNGLGAPALAAVAVAQRIRGLNMMPMFCISRALTTYTAQNYGAGKVKRIYRGLRHACLITTGIGALMAFINGMFGRQIAALFLGGEEEAVTMAYVFLRYIGATVFILGIMLNFRTAMQGLGKSISPVLCSVLETLMSMAAAFILIPHWGFTGVCLANPLSWLVSGIPLYAAFAVFTARWKQGGRAEMCIKLFTP
jgi:putative MATE family efflux protein